LIKKSGDVFNFLGFISLFGFLTTLIEAWAIGEFDNFNNIKPGVTNWMIASNFIGMAIVNFICYTIIPFFITRSGATLLNLSNVTTIIWSMLSDILLFDGEFYPLCIAAFAVELVGIILFSLRDAKKRESIAEVDTEIA